MMERYYDRARGILNLLFILSCFIFYSGFALESKLTVTELVDEALETIDGNPDKAEIEQFSLSQFINIISTANDLAWASDDEERIHLVKAATMQGQNRGLYEWLQGEIQDNLPGIRFEELPAEYIHLFQEEPKTLKIRRIEYLLKGKLSSVLDKLGPHATIGDAQRVIDPVLKLPGADVSLESSTAMSALSIVCCFILLYMYSLLSSLRLEISHLETRPLTDLVFFHLWPYSVLLGFLWILLPALASLYWVFSLSRETTLIHQVSAWSLLVIAVFLCFAIFNCRKELHDKLTNNGESA